jgi:hypothetical protein
MVMYTSVSAPRLQLDLTGMAHTHMQRRAMHYLARIPKSVSYVCLILNISLMTIPNANPTAV